MTPSTCRSNRRRSRGTVGKGIRGAAIAGVLLLGGGSTVIGSTPVSSSTPHAAPRARPCALRAHRDTEMSEGFPTGRDPAYAKSTGELRALTLFIDFPDAPARESVRARHAEFFPFVPQWYARASYGRLRYRSFPVLRYFRMPRTFESYGIARGYGWSVHRAMMRDLAAVVGRSVDFRGYDLVNVIATPNAGPPANETVLSVTWTGGTAARTHDGAQLDRVSVIYGHDQAGPRVLAHENGHSLGLPDLYAVDDFHRTDLLAGQWDTMSLDWGLQGDLFAWHKWRLGWLDDAQVGCVTTRGTQDFQLAPVELPGGRKAVVIPYGRYVAYVVEARTAQGNDSAACSEGVLVYRVRTDVDSGDGPIKVIDAHPATSACDFSSSAFNSLNDAPYRTGERFADPAKGIGVAVLGRDAEGGWTIRVTRR
ncbi:M6 family metalloprotease domain-containing protein [Streptantibioticus ferralitis]|uniref:M6 family metalloprotease domain-containing protein n=1 Tax=Streptantibioticus ferralitis TaxID=236510 RepID=A0ABT5YUU3_9ACTN|nr:M6 family metalloprotease domain-containing protein [Streptantibioticus ferralitis]MDF2255383.1 M6 family metalloprotease domain-containing protein [Streptantibioticus ferralitis]